MPGEVGNFAVAAHRSTHDEPFANIDDLRVGDKVYVQTREAWYTYTLQKDDSRLSPTDTGWSTRCPASPVRSPPRSSSP